MPQKNLNILGNKMKKITTTLITLILTIGISKSVLAEGRDTIKIVGSSTVYPFATVVAERFGRLQASKHQLSSQRDLEAV